VVSEEGQRSGTTQSVSIGVRNRVGLTLGPVVLLNTRGVQDALQVLALAGARQDLGVLSEAQAVQKLVVDDATQLRLVGQDVAVSSLPVSDRTNRRLVTREGQGRLRLQTEVAVVSVAL